MDPSVRWFVVQSILSLLSVWLGTAIARRTAHQGRAGLIIAISLMCVWTWLLYHPSVAVRIIPIGILSRIEGTASVPIFMFIIGVAWSRSRDFRQKRLVALAAVLGVVYFLQGGLWLLQTTPAVGFGEVYEGKPVRQSQEYSCVPAACATALYIVGIPTTEAEMAKLTKTRPGTGSTLLRAMDGLSIQLAGTDYDVQLLEMPVDQLATIPLPALTPLQFEPIRRHMVTLTRVQHFGVWITDPIAGEAFYTWPEFEDVYTGQLLVIDRRTKH